MPSASQLGLGFEQPLDRVLEALGLKLDFNYREEEDYIGPDEVVEEINRELAKIHKDLLLGIPGVSLVDNEDLNSNDRNLIDLGYTVVTYNGELRHVGPFLLNFAFDPSEMGDEEEDARLVIEVTSRYFPTLIDIESAHGGLKSLKPWQVKLQSKIQEKISEKYPIFKEASWLVTEHWY